MADSAPEKEADLREATAETQPGVMANGESPSTRKETDLEDATAEIQPEVMARWSRPALEKRPTSAWIGKDGERHGGCSEDGKDGKKARGDDRTADKCRYGLCS